VNFRASAHLPPDIAIKGRIAGSSLLSGAFSSSALVLKLDANVFSLGDGWNYALPPAFPCRDGDALTFKAKIGICL